MNSREIIRYLNPTPPRTLNINDPDRKTLEALSALKRIAEGYETYQYFASSKRILLGYWDRAWPWIHSLSRAALDTQPSTIAGYSAIDDVLTITPYLLGAYSDEDEFSILALRQRMDAYPTLPAVAFELWLFSVLREHPSRHLHIYTAGKSSSCVLKGGNEDSPAKAHLHDVLSSPRWDIPAAFVKGIVQEASRHSIDCKSLHCHLSFLVDIANTHHLPRDGMPTFLEACFQRGALKVVPYAILRVASRKHYDPDRIGPEIIRDIVGDGLHFIIHYLDEEQEDDTGGVPSNIAFLEAIDSGLIYSLFRHRDLIARFHTGGDVSDLSRGYSRVLCQLTRRLWFRPFMIRAVRIIKKVAKKEIDVPSYLKDCGRLIEYWRELCTEVTLRSESGDGGYSDDLICCNLECPNQGKLKMDHKYKRCGACRVEIYCSIDCQSVAWNEHKRDCQTKRKSLQARGDPTSLDLAFLRKYSYQDFCTERGVQVQQAIVHRIIDNNHSLVLMNYCDPEHSVKPISVRQLRDLLWKDPENVPFTAKDLEEAFSGVAFFPWYGLKRRVAVFIRTPTDRIATSRAKALGVHWDEVAVAMAKQDGHWPAFSAQLRSMGVDVD
ncbi:hypothetical protein V5O48_010281 [Marasmius crinis-equi]|uniref:MYND-type domain-containing protein n=1 Tax=Marasmius crinis-equi TaxID=585013 RepID=A0ABR3F9F2_9AGAR